LYSAGLESHNWNEKSIHLISYFFIFYLLRLIMVDIYAKRHETFLRKKNKKI
jgi:hypothetical protein